MKPEYGWDLCIHSLHSDQPLLLARGNFKDLERIAEGDTEVQKMKQALKLLQTSFSLMYDTHLHAPQAAQTLDLSMMQILLSAQRISMSNCADPVFCSDAQSEELSA